jgi:hypothetical protein
MNSANGRTFFASGRYCGSAGLGLQTVGPLVASLGRIDRFPAILSGGLEPYLEHASQLIPHPNLPQ